MRIRLSDIGIKKDFIGEDLCMLFLLLGLRSLDLILSSYLLAVACINSRDTVDS